MSNPQNNWDGFSGHNLLYTNYGRAWMNNNYYKPLTHSVNLTLMFELKIKH